MNRSGSKVRFWRVLLALMIVFFAGAALALAFAEEPLAFRDPYTGQLTDQEISTIHDDLTYVLALAAGFSVTDSIKLQAWDQLTDSEALGPENSIAYQNARELGALHDWGWGLTKELEGYEAYAWGSPTDLTVMRASCLYTRTSVIAMPAPAGSLEAFAIYLHSLADSYSHLDCITVLDSLGRPWATHTSPPIDTSVPACDFHPRTPQADDVHGREFYTYTDSLRSDAAIAQIYGELRARSWQRDGRYLALDLNSPLVGLPGRPTLDQALYAFVHTWAFDGAANRRNYADQMAAAILALRQPLHRTFLPMALKREDGRY